MSWDQMPVINKVSKFIKALEDEVVKLSDTSSPLAVDQAVLHLSPTIRRATKILSQQTKRSDWTNRVTGKSGKGFISGTQTDSRGVSGSEQRPSIRHEKAGRSDGPIYLNWGFEFNRNSKSFLIQNSARHMGVLLGGSTAHKIPKQRSANTLLRFFRGSPLKWDATSEDTEGWNFSRQVRHPGVEGNEEKYQDLFEEAFNQATQDHRYENNVTDYFQDKVLSVRQEIFRRLGTNG